MKLIRFFFCKTGEAAYISHLDLQRVMARALRRGQVPVWYSQGFNPHIYMTFALPLPLMQESICEMMDCKTESEISDFSSFAIEMNKALPRGLEVRKIKEPKFSAADIAFAEYDIAYPENKAGFAKCVQKYNELDVANVIKRTKRSETEVNLKEHVQMLAIDKNLKEVAHVRLPAGGNNNFNPELLTRFIEENLNLKANNAQIMRTGVFTVNGELFE